jgi:hypothetical protein
MRLQIEIILLPLVCIPIQKETEFVCLFVPAAAGCPAREERTEKLIHYVAMSNPTDFE